MSYITKNLILNEKILFRTKKSWVIFIAPLFWSAIALFFYNYPSPLIQKVAILPMIAAAIYWIHEGLEFYFAEFAITNVRVMMREGYLIRHTNDTRLAALANVTVNQSLLGQLLNYGTIHINSFGGESDPYRAIHRPAMFQKKLQEQLYTLQKSPLV